MFYRKISTIINEYLDDENAEILCISGARQIGKTFIIRELAKKKFKNYIELNMADDFLGEKRFKDIKTIGDFYLQVSISSGDRLGNKSDTIIFIDEIQIYPELLTLLKALFKDNRYKYICSGSELGIAFSKTTLIPMGSIKEVKMYPMDFEEFLMAISVGEYALNFLKESFLLKKTLDESTHNKILELFKTYLYVGGLPDAIKAYIETKNVFKIRQVQTTIINFYKEDATKYDKDNKLKIKRIYDLIPSNLENKVKRIQFKDIEQIEDVRFSRYKDEFEYLVSAGIALETKAISEPKFPLIQSSSKNLIKLYLNDVGLLTNILYRQNINAILKDEAKINLGAVYETVVAQELSAHSHELFYYDRRKVGEVDFLINDYENLSITPIEVKSGRDVINFKALPKLLNNINYKIEKAYVLSNNKDIKIDNNIIYLPIYFVMFL